MNENQQIFTRKDGCIWRPVFTLARNEKKLNAALQAKGIAAYLPMRKHINIQPVISKGKNYCYKRELLVPMFSNYIFAQLSPDEYSELVRNRSVIRILPVTESEEERLLEELAMIRSLERFAAEEKVDVSCGIVKGMRVKFTDGGFAGWEGVVANDANDEGFVYINVTAIDANVRLQYPAAWCRPVDGERAE